MKSRGILEIFLLAYLLVFPMGCREEKPTSQVDLAKDAEEAKRKQRILSDRTATIPSESAVVVSYVKPGHWYQANARLTANQQDESLVVSLAPIDRQEKEVPLTAGTAPIRFERTVALARGQQKNVSLLVLQPDISLNSYQDLMDFSKDTTPALLRLQYSAKGFGTPLLQENNPLRLLYGYQYCVVTLCSDPARHSYLKALDSATWSSQIRAPEERITPHRILDLKDDDLATLFPSRLYAMTSISHLMINDGSPALLGIDQQQAVLDWLHFGGTIIINGMEGLDKVESSFLRPYAPLIDAKSGSWSEADTEQLNRSWTVPRMEDDNDTPFSPARAIPKIQGRLREGARWMDNLEGLVAEQFVGQGRVVMTTFPMNDSSFQRWPSYSSLVHNAVFRMPARTVVRAKEEIPLNPNSRLTAEEYVPLFDTLYADSFQGTELNPIHSTRLRLWARDLDLSTSHKRAGDKARGPNSPLNTSVPERIVSPFPEGKKTGLGGWNAESDVLNSAKASLQESSGITVPKVTTIVWLLAGYLIVLVPINWAVFRLANRVELAWVMAPIIAIVGAFIVARSVQLDVGFSRSQTSYGFLQCHAGYSRGVLSNYLALYTSLTTNYQALYPDDTGVVTPLPLSSDSTAAKRRLSVDGYDYTFAGDGGVGLIKAPVLSNTTGLLSSEEMLDLEGAFDVEFDDEMGNLTLFNRSKLDLYDVGIIGASDGGQFLKGWIGDLEIGGEVACKLENPKTVDRWLSQWELNPTLSKPDLVLSNGNKWTSSELPDDLYLGKMLEMVASRYPFGRGELVAIGWTHDQLSGLRISPDTNQKRHKTMVLIHLRYAKPEPVKPDKILFPAVKLESAIEPASP